MQYVLRFRIATNRAAGLRGWLQDHTQDRQRDVPEGWAYDATYFVVRGFGDYDCEMRWNLENYAALDSENPPGFTKLVKEWQGFVNDATAAQATLLKSLDDVIIIA